jgi:uncharacterized surface protein with fasciclin (FAS1) repeats
VGLRQIGAITLLAVTLTTFACSGGDDDDSGVPPVTSAVRATRASTPSTTAPLTSADPTTTGVPAPSGPGCAGFPHDGPGSLAAIATEPAGTAISLVPRLSAMVAATDAAGLLDALDGPGPLTLFVPTNAAFNAIPPAELDRLLTDPGALDTVLRYHAVDDDLSRAELVEAGEAIALEGQPMTFAERRGGVTMNGGQARIVCADIPTANGTLHVIDGVLLPPAAEGDESGGTMLYSVDLGTGAATRIGRVGGRLGMIGMAIAPGDGVSTVYGLTDVPELVTFDGTDPRRIDSSVPITGVAQGSSLLAIDTRPNGDIVALSDASVVYTIDPTSGAATAVGDAFVPPLSDPGFGFDVDPDTDQIRISVVTGQNMTADPTTGAATVHDDVAYAGTDANAGTTPRVVAAAYTAAADLYVIDAATGSLARQAPADRGVLTTLGPLDVSVTDGASFDIAASGEALLASPG